MLLAGNNAIRQMGPALGVALLASPQVAPADRPAADPAAIATRALAHQQAGRLAEAVADYERLLELPESR